MCRFKVPPDVLLSLVSGFKCAPRQLLSSARRFARIVRLLHELSRFVSCTCLCLSRRRFTGWQQRAAAAVRRQQPRLSASLALPTSLGLHQNFNLAVVSVQDRLGDALQHVHQVRKHCCCHSHSTLDVSASPMVAQQHAIAHRPMHTYPFKRPTSLFRFVHPQGGRCEA